MKLEPLKLPKLESLGANITSRVFGGMATGRGIHNGTAYASDCAEFGQCGRVHIEFYDVNGDFISEYLGPDPCPGTSPK